MRIRNYKLRIAILICMAVIVIILAAVLVFRIKEELAFSKALPKPEDSSEIWITSCMDDTLVFKDFVGNSIVIAFENTSYQSFHPVTGNSATTLVLMDCGDRFIRTASEWVYRCTFEQIFVPAGISEESLTLLKNSFPDAVVETVSKGDRAICGSQFAIYFYGTDEAGALLLSHGYDTYFVGGDFDVKGLKGKDITVSFYSKEHLLNSGLSVKYAVFEADEEIDSMKLIENVYEYALEPGYKYGYYSDGQGTVNTDLQFTPTGRIGER